jgi:hypothetical protein
MGPTGPQRLKSLFLASLRFLASSRLNKKNYLPRHMLIYIQVWQKVATLFTTLLTVVTAFSGPLGPQLTTISMPHSRLEECITHAACLLEAIQRWRLAGLPTFGVFIDLKKAYDMVPHEAVFAKMRCFGIRGWCYDFIVALYKRSTIQVRLGHGSGAAYTDPFGLERGVRQGCPLSCILFNIFINDLFDDMPYRKVVIPRGTRKKPILPAMGLAGLFLTNDALSLASTIEETCMLCDHVTKWTEANEMRVGIKKHGIMEWGSDGAGGYSDESTLPDPEYDMPMVIGGEPVPVLSEYLHLCVTITCTQVVKDLLAHRLESGPKRVYKYYCSLVGFTTVPMNKWLQLTEWRKPVLTFLLAN